MAVPEESGQSCMALFDIVSTYRRLLSEDPDLTMPIAAIESLVLALSHSTFSTISETLTLISQHSASLKAAVPNPISLSAGTDLFQRYLITTLQRPSLHGSSSITASGSAATDDADDSAIDEDFQSIRNHLIRNGHLFVARAKEARAKIAAFARHFVRDGCTVLTSGGSRVVGAVLRSAADASSGSVRFRVIYVMSPSLSGSAREGTAIVTSLRERGVPVATIPESAVGYALGKTDMVIVGAEGVVENGGIISRLGTYQMGMLAKAMRKPFYVVAESHKFVRLYPLGQYDLPIAQRVVDFQVYDEGKEAALKDDSNPRKQAEAASDDEGVSMAVDEHEDTVDQSSQSKCSVAGINGLCDAVDYTPPDLISGIITESGVLTPSAVSEELIKIWF